MFELQLFLIFTKDFYLLLKHELRTNIKTF